MKILKKFDQFVTEKNEFGYSPLKGKAENPSGAGFNADDEQSEFGISPVDSSRMKAGKFKTEGQNGFGNKFNKTSDKEEKISGGHGFGKLPLSGGDTDPGKATFAGKKSFANPMRKEDEEGSANFGKESGFGKQPTK